MLHILDSMAAGQVQDEVVRLTRRLSGDRIRHIVCVRGQAGGLSDRLEMDVDFFSLDLDVDDRAAAEGFAKVIRDQRPDVVHARQSALWPDAAKACQRTSHRGLLLSHHGPNGKTDMGWFQRYRHRRMFRSIARAGFAASPPAGRELARMLRLDTSEVPIVTTGVDPQQYHPDTKTDSAESGTIHWGAVGRLASGNNWPMVIRVMRRLRDKGTKVHLDIIGDGPAHDQLQSCIVEHGLEASSAMLAATTRRDWYMRQWDGFLLTSMDDVIAYGALLEAMASGLGVVAVGSPGRYEPVRSGKNGFAVHRDNESQLFDAMWRLSTNRELRQSLGQAARQTVLQSYSDAAAARKLAWIYDWIGSHPGRGIDEFIGEFQNFDRQREPSAI